MAMAGAVLLALAALPAVAGGSTGAPDGPADAATLDAHLEEEMARSPLPGLAVAVTHGEELVHLGGYGTAGDGRPMTPDTPMRAASLSKSFTAAAVLQLVAPIGSCCSPRPSSWSG